MTSTSKPYIVAVFVAGTTLWLRVHGGQLCRKAFKKKGKAVGDVLCVNVKSGNSVPALDAALDELRRAPCPAVNIVGNHELYNFDRAALSEASWLRQPRRNRTAAAASGRCRSTLSDRSASRSRLAAGTRTATTPAPASLLPSPEASEPAVASAAAPAVARRRTRRAAFPRAVRGALCWKGVRDASH